MPTHKTEILGSLIEINYEEPEKDKLKKIIEKFNNRLLDHIIQNALPFESIQGETSARLFEGEMLFFAFSSNVICQNVTRIFYFIIIVAKTYSFKPLYVAIFLG